MAIPLHCDPLNFEDFLPIPQSLRISILFQYFVPILNHYFWLSFCLFSLSLLSPSIFSLLSKSKLFHATFPLHFPIQLYLHFSLYSLKYILSPLSLCILFNFSLHFRFLLSTLSAFTLHFSLCFLHYFLTSLYLYFLTVLSPLLTLSLYFLLFSLYYHALLILITSHSTFSLNFLTLLSLSNSTFFVHFPLHSQTIFSSHWNQPNHGMDNHSFPWEFVTKKRIGTQFNPIHGSIPFSISF